MDKLKFEEVWKVSLFSLDPLDCCLAAFCAPCFYAKTRSDYDGSNILFNICTLTPAAIRGFIRVGYEISGDWVSDVLFATLCVPCTSVQLRREVDRRGKINLGSRGSPKGWDSSLFDCSSDMGGCIMSFICTPCAVGEVMQTQAIAPCPLAALCITPPLALSLFRQRPLIGVSRRNLSTPVCILLF